MSQKASQGYQALDTGFAGGRWPHRGRRTTPDASERHLAGTACTTRCIRWKSLSQTSPPVEGERPPPVAVRYTTHAAKRGEVAEKIVERYKLYAALGGLSPLPVVTAAGVTTIILRMVKLLSNLYGVPFERDRTRSVVAGLMGGAVPAGLGIATASTLALALPGVGFVGVAVSSLTAAAATEKIGLVFIDRFERGVASAAVAGTPTIDAAA